MLCSIITVCKNNIVELQYTLASILINGKLPKNCECLIVDDSDNDDIQNYLSSLDVDDLGYQRGDSKSLYSAMNIGITKAKGEFIWFLNSGDRKSEDFDIQRLETERADLVYGNTKYVKNGTVVLEQSKPCFNLSDIKQLRNSLPCHQSIIFKTCFIRRHRLVYNEELRISADYQFIKDCVQKSATIYYFPITISEFTFGGASNNYQTLSAAILHGNELSLTRNLTTFSEAKLQIKLCIKFLLAKLY